MSDAGQIYFIGPADRAAVKIGFSADPAKRVRALSTGSHVPLELFCSAPGTEDDEHALHKFFARHRSHKEWFRGHGDVLAAIEEIKASGRIPERFLKRNEAQKPAARVAVTAGGRVDILELRCRLGREGAPISQTTLAAMCGVHQGTISRWEINPESQKGPGLLVLRRIFEEATTQQEARAA